MNESVGLDRFNCNVNRIHINDINGIDNSVEVKQMLINSVNKWY